VDATNVDRRGRKIRRTGRHTTPSPVEKVAEKAGKAAPAVAIAGVLVAAAPQASAAVKAPTATTAAAQVRTAAGTVALVRRDAPAATARTYTVRSGDSLSKISKDFYGTSADWRSIYDANRSKISNPNDIFVGERLTIPAHGSSSTASYTPKHAKAKPKPVVLTSKSSPSGNLGCSGLEALWEDAGGAHADAFMAAEIAMAESGGRQYALSPTDDFGYWQINGSHGPSEATFNPLGNARAAIAISDDGSNWHAWTTYTEGLYEGRC
jgi:LysM repeat protein